ncbi:stage II sporulation protein M [Candidatus Woesearchaeota archaeon]|nr:stage II sporulation protein M [Candidatus Woesearchaeota archaeon]
MVLEQIYTPDFLRSKPLAGFLLGIAYSVIAISFALFLFPDDPALVAVALVAILSFPSLAGLSRDDEERERKEHVLSFRHIVQDNKAFLFVYVSMFFGVLLTFSFFSIAFSQLAAGAAFKQQLAFRFGGHAVFNIPTFQAIFMNNLSVMLLAFLISLVAGNGAMFLLAWNASVWGAIFGMVAKTAALNIAGSSWTVFGLVMLSVFPHTLLEALAYILAAIAGTVLSDAIVVERFSSDELRSVVEYNLALLGIALAVLIVAAVVETYVLGNFTLYQRIVQLSFG